MHTPSAQFTTNGITSALKAAYPDLPTRPTLYTVEQFAKAQPAFSAPSLRNLIFKAEARQSTKGEIPGNGLIECGAIVRIGRKVLIDETRFFEWVRRQNDRTQQEPQTEVRT
jgi:hypothetical protein